MTAQLLEPPCTDPYARWVWQGSAGNRCPYADQIANSLTDKRERNLDRGRVTANTEVTQILGQFRGLRKSRRQTTNNAIRTTSGNKAAGDRTTIEKVK